MAKRKHPGEEARELGGFVPLPHVVLKSNNYASLSPHALKLLNDLLAQYNGHNNGDLGMAWKIMQARNWKSQATLHKAKRELLAKDWIEVARRGGRNKASLYAVTFFAVNECRGKLDIPSTHSPKSTWRNHEPVTPLKVDPRRIRLIK